MESLPPSVQKKKTSLFPKYCTKLLYWPPQGFFSLLYCTLAMEQGYSLKFYWPNEPVEPNCIDLFSIYQ